MKNFLLFLFLFSSLVVKAQLLHNKEFLAGINSVTTKSFSGSGGGGYQTFEKFDELGRTVSKDYYRRKELLAIEVYQYNQMNDQTLWVQTFDINNPSRIDSTIFEYDYNSYGIITKQKQTYSNRRDSVIYELIELLDDTLNYTKNEYYYRPNTGTMDTYLYEYSLLLNSNNQVTYKKIIDLQESTTEVTENYYPSNGQLIRRKITRSPEPEREIVYVVVQEMMI